MEVMDRFVPYMEVSLHPAYDNDVPTLLFFLLNFSRLLIILPGGAAMPCSM
jgi:hypothetical protein